MSHDQAERQRDNPLRLLHHHPGYLRVQADVFLGRAEKDPVITSVSKALDEIPGFRRWSYSPKTGSIVVEYEVGELDTDHVLARIAKKAGLTGVVIDTRSTAHRRELVSGFLDAVEEVNKIVGQATGEKADLRELVPAVFAAVSVVTFILGDRRGGRLPRWDSALYHSYRIFMQWHRVEVRDREKAGKKCEDKEDEARAAGREVW